MVSYLKLKAISIAFLIIFSIFSIYAPAVKAQQKACCEKTNANEYCVFTDVGNCDKSGRIAYTTCEQTNFCSLGCCYSSSDGSCNKNTPKALCNSKKDASYIESPNCDIAACQKGCCLIGEEAFFVTQTQCKQYGSQFPNMKVNFDSSASTEKACLEKSRSQEIGCCVTEEACSFTTRDACATTNENIESPTQPTTATGTTQAETPVSGTASQSEAQTTPATQAESQEQQEIEQPAIPTTGSINIDVITGYQTQETPESAKPVFIGNKGFYKNTLCSNDKLQCGCAKQHHTECYQGRVYWYDSCGNRENIYDANKAKSYNKGFVLPIASSCKAKVNDLSCGNCDYSQGTLCGQAPLKIKPKYGDLACIGLNCDSTYNDQISPNAGGDKKHGESWCVYDKYPGLGKDRPGARHYRHLCIAGEEYVEPCEDFRGQLCVQGLLGKEIFETQESFDLQKGSDYVEAGCRTNRFNQCVKFTKKSECENVAYSDCYWMEAGIVNRTKEIESVGISGDIEITPPGICVPLVPPGLKFWPDEETINLGKEIPAGQQSATGKSPDLDAAQICNSASRECVVVFESAPLRGISNKCIQNCHCLKEDWKIAGYNLCTSQGDCGAKYNTLDKVSLLGFEYTNEKNKNEKFTSSDLGKTALARAGRSADKPSFFDAFSDNYGWVGLLGIASTGLIEGLGTLGTDEPFTKAFWSGATSGPGLLKEGWNLLKGQFSAGTEKTPTLTITPEEETETIQTSTTPEEPTLTITPEDTGSVIGIDAITGNALEGTEAESALNEIDKIPEASEEGSFLSSIGGSIPGWFGPAINGASWLFTLYSAIDAITTKYKTYKVATVCNPWVAPLGGKDCEKCNEKFKPCSEYKCRSLGQTCRLINPGTSDEKCINMHPNDVNSPIITPNKDALTKGYTIKDAGATIGFEINERIDPYSPLSIGINTNEPATCKYSTNASMKYDDMPFVFGSSLFLYNQTMIVSLPQELASEEALKQTHGLYTLYLKCMDASGNKNNRDYYIKLKIKPGKDLTPPIIEAASLKDNAYLAANIKETEFSIFTNEPGTCRYSSNDVEYDSMKNEFTCSQSGFMTASLFYTTYECKTTLKDIKQGSNAYYLRCKDLSNNVNQEGFKFNLIGTKPLLINQTSPSGEILSNNVTLEVFTQEGAQDGKAVCGYKLGNAPNVEFKNTNADYHFEDLFLNIGTYDYAIICNDVAGNEAKSSIKFKITKDLEAPKLIFIFKDATASLLHIELNEVTTCEYSTLKPFKFGDGTRMTNENAKIHEAALVEDSNKFYITCQDVFTNEYNFIVYP